MSYQSFFQKEREAQIAWRKVSLSDQQPGGQNRGRYPHVLPSEHWELNLWDEIRSELLCYIDENNIQPHTGKHNLCSSWVLCANLYFPFREAEGLDLLAGFLSNGLGLPVDKVRAIEFEWEAKEDRLKPAELLGEPNGKRGTGQTSPDVAFEVDTPKGTGIILVESKYTEHWFYQCSGYRARKEDPYRRPNMNPARCKDFPGIVEDPTRCHLTEWKRTYWDYLKPNFQSAAKMGACCPAAFGGYQLLRQHALAEALNNHGDWHLVISAVAYDERNKELFNVIRLADPSKGKADARTYWADLFGEYVRLLTFTHQQWVQWVRDSTNNQQWQGWLKYIGDLHIPEQSGHRFRRKPDTLPNDSGH